MQHTSEFQSCLSRREMLVRSGMGFGALALQQLLASELPAQSPATSDFSVSPLAPKLPHFAAKAKHVIHIFANGGPSHVDTFDPKHR